MNYNPEIFRAYDIRGVYGKDFDEDFAFKLGLALVVFLNRKKFLVANDGRGFSNSLAQSLINGITTAGGDADYLGLATTPLFNFAFGKYKANGGVMVTGSHNPAEYGGFKIFDWQGNPIGRPSGLARINDLIQKDILPTAKSSGRIRGLDHSAVHKEYTKFIVRKSGIRPDRLAAVKFRISGPETIRKEAAILLEVLGLQNAETGFEIVFTFDGDADRIMIFDRSNQPIRADYIVGLLARDAVRFLSKPKVVHDLRFSKGVTAKMVEWGIKAFRSKVGRTHVRAQMIKHRADIGGELSGHVYFREANFNELPLLLMLKILKIMAKSKMTINELIKPFQAWFNSGEINFEMASETINSITGRSLKPQDPALSFSHDRIKITALSDFHDRGKMIVGDLPKFKLLRELLEQKYSDGELDDLDGLTVQYSDWWFNLRPSNTEPVLRLVVEAKTKTLLDERVNQLSEKIKAAI